MSFDAIRKDKISLTKLYIKCVLENHLEKNNWDDLPVAMEFAEFLFIKLRNALMSFKVIHRLLNRQLSPFGLLRMVRLKKVIKEESEVMKKEWPNQLDF